eukprot:911484_1
MYIIYVYSTLSDGFTRTGRIRSRSCLSRDRILVSVITLTMPRDYKVLFGLVALLCLESAGCTENSTPDMDVSTAVAMVGGGVVAVALIPVILVKLGFTVAGVVAGSLAAWIQSFFGNVASGTLFAAFQSAGVLGASATTNVAVAGAGASAGVALRRFLKGV